MVQLMLWFVEHSTDDQLRQICLHHLKFLSSQVEIHHKKITGNLGGISVSYVGKIHFSQAFVKIISTYNTGIILPSVFSGHDEQYKEDSAGWFRL